LAIGNFDLSGRLCGRPEWLFSPRCRATVSARVNPVGRPNLP
jgi:hypothetical protein